MSNYRVLRVELNSAGVRKLLQSQGVMSCVQSQASTRMRGLGTGYELGTAVGHDRARAYIKAVTKEAKRENRKNNTLLKALGG